MHEERCACDRKFRDGKPDGFDISNASDNLIDAELEVAAASAAGGGEDQQ